MNFDDFLEKLKEANLSKDDFMKLTGSRFGTFKGWGSTRLGRRTPEWTKSWIENFIELNRLRTAIEVFRNNG